MKNLTVKHATEILNWYALEGQGNWGTWGNYPSLPVNASYNSFDTCHLRLLMSEQVSFGGQEFNCIATSHNVPGKTNGVVSLSFIKEVCEAAGVLFVNEYMTKDKADELTAKRLADAKRVVADFEVMATYEYQEAKVREQITNALSNITISKEFGQPVAKSLVHILKTSNYCEKETAELEVSVELTGTNSKRTCGYYKAVSYDTNRVEEIVKLFTNERVASYTANLERHTAKLKELATI